MNRIDACLDQLKGTRAAFVPYVTAGDPHPDQTVGILHALAENGADIIELGMPFSDPMADGPVIQLACERALAAGASLNHVLEAVTEFRREDNRTALVLMGYLNPIERFGSEAFFKAAASAGVDGLLLVDLPPEESASANAQLRQLGLHQIFLVAPTTTPARLNQIAALASGFIYHVSLKGITGAGHLDVRSVGKHVARIRETARLPIAVGFGIRSPADVAALGAVADAVVVGSALVAEMAGADAGQAAIKAGQFVAAMAAALRERENQHS